MVSAGGSGSSGKELCVCTKPGRWGGPIFTASPCRPGIRRGSLQLPQLPTAKKHNITKCWQRRKITQMMLLIVNTRTTSNRRKRAVKKNHFLLPSAAHILKKNQLLKRYTVSLKAQSHSQLILWKRTFL